MSTSHDQPGRRARHRIPEPETPDPFEVDRPRTWWERNSITVMAIFSLVMLVFVITFQMSC